MNCSKCGAPNADQAKICSACGNTFNDILIESPPAEKKVIPIFAYEARDKTGILKKGAIEAPDVRAACRILADLKLTVVKIKETVATE